MVIKEGCLFEGGGDNTAEEIADQQAAYEKEARYIRQLYGEPTSVIFFNVADPDGGREEPCFRILMRKVPGVKLADALESAENDIERLCIIKQSLLASQQLNEEEHIAHGDLSVGNIMIERVMEGGETSFVARIIDFGESEAFDPASDDSDTDHLLNTLARVLESIDSTELTRAFIAGLAGLTVVEKVAQVNERLCAAVNDHFKSDNNAVFLKLRAAGVLEVLAEMVEPEAIRELLATHVNELFVADTLSLLSDESLLEFKAYCIECQRNSSARAASSLFATAAATSPVAAADLSEAKDVEASAAGGEDAEGSAKPSGP